MTAFVEADRVNPKGFTGREGFDPSQHPRSETGKFTAKAGTPSEISLSPRWTEVWEFEDDWKMFVETANRYHPEYKRAWLLDHEGTALGMIHWSHQPGKRFGEACICDIEVREEYRGRGLAKRLILSVEDELSETLHTTGGFTPEGEAALGTTPQHPGYPKPSHGYRSMSFVHDWDSLTPAQ